MKSSVFLTFVSGIYIQPTNQKRENAIKYDGLGINYTPLPSLALGLNSLDLHLLHLSAFGAFNAPHFMHTFLFNNRASASGNLVILKPPYLVYRNKEILFKRILVRFLKKTLGCYPIL